jgi:4-methylaminobutanoate oxidase (formaldehyde-forming)
METPYEAGLGFCVRLDKGDFVGREALVKAKEAGLNKKLCTLVLDGDDYLTVYGGEAVYYQGKVTGRVRSGGYGFTVGRNIAYAYLPMDLAKVGTRVEVEVFDTCVGAEVSPAVLLDPKGTSVRA